MTRDAVRHENWVLEVNRSGWGGSGETEGDSGMCGREGVGDGVSSGGVVGCVGTVGAWGGIMGVGGRKEEGANVYAAEKNQAGLWNCDENVFFLG